MIHTDGRPTIANAPRPEPKIPERGHCGKYCRDEHGQPCAFCVYYEQREASK